MADCNADIYFDDKLVYSCKYTQPKDAININNIEIPFPENAKSCTIKMVYRYTNPDNVGIFPPLLKIVSDYTKNRFLTASANFYCIPSSISALIFIMICGLFLLGIAMERIDYSLILLAISTGAMTVYNMSMNGGYYFLPDSINNLFTNSTIKYIIPISVIIYIILNRKKKLFKYYINICFLLLACIPVFYIISLIGNGNLASSINYMFSSALFFGTYLAMFHWLTLFIVISCAIAALVYHIFSFAGVEAEANFLKTQNEITRKSYDTVLKSFRQTSGLRHRWKSDIIALQLMYNQNKIEEMGKYLERLGGTVNNMPKIEFSANYTINSIIQYAAAEADSMGIKLNADVLADEKLNISDEDLCTLLVNMLDNAIEACKDTENTREKSIDIRIKQSKNFLSVKCSNTCHMDIKKSNNDLKTTKKDKLNHGFGLKQMERVARKYNSLLDINMSDGTFTVQTSLCNIKPENNK